ncbi:MAG: hypothetical protein AAF813_03925 [Pseudomonadota bacterium]
MKRVLCLCLIAACASPAFADPSLGVTSMTMAEDTGRPLALTLWHPGEGGAPEAVGGNAVFEGVMATRGASVDGDQLPLVLLSHGGLRSAGDSGAWLAAGLADAGYLAVEINAPRAANDAAAVDEIWRRPDDVSQALDHVLRVPEWSAYIDPDRISVVGFALGGTAAIALAGADFDVPSFVDSCAEVDGGPDCGWYAAQGVSLEAVDQEALAETRQDPRIRLAVAISPEYLGVFSGGGPSVGVPTLVISLGGQAALSDGGSLSQATLGETEVFDAFQLCTAAGPEILSEDGGDPAICGASSEARAEAHRRIVEEIVTFLRASEG